MIKKTLISALSLVILAGCGTPPTTYDAGKISVMFTEEWNLIQNPSFLPKDMLKENEKLVFIMHLNNAATLTVIKKNFIEDIIPDEFIAQSLAQPKTIPDYELIKEVELRIGGQKTAIHTFKDPKSTYIQSFLTDKNNAYVITAILEKELTPEINTEILKTIKSIKINP